MIETFHQDKKWSFADSYVWGNDFPSCMAKNQSPIDINTGNVQICNTLCDFTLHYKPSTCKVNFINDQVNECSANEESKTIWGDNCDSAWSSSKIVSHIINNISLNNPYKIDTPLIQTSQDPRIQAEGKAGQSTDKGIIFVSENAGNIKKINSICKIIFFIFY